MSGFAIFLFLVIIVPVIAFGVWQLMQEALVRIDSGTVGLLLIRGKVTNRVLTPGVHFVWPFRKMMIQGYPLRELTYLATDDGAVEDTDFADPPLSVVLGDRGSASVQYTIRFRIRTDGLGEVHDRVGPDGIKRLVRDHSRQIIIDEMRSQKYGIDHAFGPQRDELESALSERLTAALHLDGFELIMFSLRHIDLGAVGDVIAATVRATAELDLERAVAQVRALRADNEAATFEQLDASLTDTVVRYRQIELGREVLQRWDGRVVVNDPGVAARSGLLRGVAAGAATGDEPAAGVVDAVAETMGTQGEMP
jgi:regulator of protease activity HflC (stomatin/prohibitin superfamily)